MVGIPRKRVIDRSFAREGKAMGRPQYPGRRRIILFAVFIMLGCARMVQADEVWLDVLGDGEYLLAPLSTISSWSYGGSLGIEARNLFTKGLALRLRLGYGEYLPADEWLSYMRMASAVASVGYRISLGSSLGLSPYAGGGIGVVFSSSAVDAASYTAGTYTHRSGSQALGEAGVAMDVPIGRAFELRLMGAYKLMLESEELYSGVRAGLGVGWKTPLGPSAKKSSASDRTRNDAAPSPSKARAAQDVDTALNDLKNYPSIRLVKERGGIRLVLESSFNANSADLGETTKTQLRAIGMALSKLRISRAVIRGYVAPDHDSATDVDISLARAKAVASWLKANGNLAGVTVETVGMGRADPVADSSTEESRARNRRVEIFLTLR